MKARSIRYLLLALVLIGGLAAYYCWVKPTLHHRALINQMYSLDEIRTVGKSLDEFKLRHGRYPVFGSYQQMIDVNSPLVLERLLPSNMNVADNWGRPFLGQSIGNHYSLKCLGDPSRQTEFPPFTVEGW